MGVVIRQSIKASAVTYIGAFIGFVTTMFLRTEFLTEEDNGLLSVLLEAGTMFGAIAALGTSSSIIRFFPYFRNENNRDNGFFRYAVLLPLTGCLIVIPLYLLLKHPISLMFRENSPLLLDYYLWAVPLIAIMAFWGVFESYSSVKMRIVVPKINREVFLRLLLAAVYILFGYHIISTRQGLVSCYIFAYLIPFLATMVYALRIGAPSFRRGKSFTAGALRRDISRYTTFMVIGTLGTSLLPKLDIFMVGSMVDLGAAGVYTIAFYMSAMIEIPQRSITGISSPIASEALRSGDVAAANELYKKVSLHQLIAGGAIFVLIWMNIDRFFEVIPNGEIYAQGKWVVFYVGLSKIVFVTLNFGNVMISFSKYYRWTLIFTFFVIAAGIAANLLLIPVMGISGAAVSTLVITVLSNAFQQWIVLKKIGGNPYSGATLKAIALLALLLLAGMALPDADNPWIDMVYRSAIIIAAGGFSFYYLKISEDMNKVIRSILGRFASRK